MNTVVFDVGGTLMEYKNMPYVWIEFYKTAFEYVRSALKLQISDSDIEESVERLKSYNPKIKYREIDYSPDVIFSHATEHWQCSFSLREVIDAFFSSLKLTPYIYPETISVLQRLRAGGINIATLTDVATGMPDELHKSYLTELMPYFDLYVSSISCGFRKPNPKGMQDIARYFGCGAEDMIFVGDEEKDVATAKRFGCRSVLIDRNGAGYDFGQDVTISDLTQLMALI